jgi:hypothetical protein
VETPHSHVDQPQSARRGEIRVISAQIFAQRAHETCFTRGWGLTASAEVRGLRYLDAFEVAVAFPIRDGGSPGPPLVLRVVQHVMVHVVTEAGPSKRAVLP